MTIISNDSILVVCLFWFKFNHSTVDTRRIALHFIFFIACRDKRLTPSISTSSRIDNDIIRAIWNKLKWETRFYSGKILRGEKKPLANNASAYIHFLIGKLNCSCGERSITSHHTIHHNWTAFRIRIPCVIRIFSVRNLFDFTNFHKVLHLIFTLNVTSMSGWYTSNYDRKDYHTFTHTRKCWNYLSHLIQWNRSCIFFSDYLKNIGGIVIELVCLRWHE